MKFFSATQNRNGRLLAIAFLLICGVKSHAQSTNSTYSRFGIGTIVNGSNIKSVGAGGLQSPLLDANTINLYNPASYSVLEMTTFQVSGRGTFLKSETTDAQSKYRGGSIGEMSIAFKKPGSKWGFAVGLRPYSIAGYSLSQEVSLSDSLKAEYNYEGSGGLNEAILGVGHFRIIKNKRLVWNETKNAKDTLNYNHVLCFGLNTNYLFGNVTQTNRVVFSNVLYNNTRTTRNLFAQGILFQGGLIYQIPLKLEYEGNRKLLKESSYLQLGGTYTMGRDLRTRVGVLTESFKYLSDGAEIPIDTAYQITGSRGHLSLPQRFTFGVAFKKTKQQVGTLILGIEFTAQNWSTYKVSNSDEGEVVNYLNQFASLGFGLEYKPSDTQNTNLLHAIHYRVGARFEDSMLTLNNIGLQNKVVSAGLSIPLLKTNNRLHLSAEYGRFGTTENDLVFEKQTTIWFGFTFTPREPWFFQRKYD
jgi:hypothetical protein